MHSAIALLRYRLPSLNPRALFVCFVCFVGLLFGTALTGCASIAVTRAQAQGKLPAANLDDAEVEVSTIYGYAYTLKAAKVRVDDKGRKTYEGYSEISTSPIGHVTVRAKKAEFALPAEEKK